MISAAEICTLAKQLGGPLTEAQEQALVTLSAAVQKTVASRLLTEADESDEALLCGAAYLALSYLARPEAEQFTAGSISISRGKAIERAALYASLAQRLLAPYTAPTDFAFLGVEA